MSGGTLVPVEDVPMPTGPDGLDPRMFEVVPFSGYDEAGRFTDEGKMGIAFLETKVAAGQRILINVLADPVTEWFDAATGQIRVRPVLEVPATLTSSVNSTGETFELPACSVTFDGPISMVYEHPGGPFAVGFTMPGTYTIKAEPFPYRAFTTVLTVTP